MFTSTSPRWTSLFSGWQILMSTSKECINCILLYDWRESCLLIDPISLHKSLCLPGNWSKPAHKLTLHKNHVYSYPHSNARLQFRLKLERWKPHKDACHPTICDLINDVKLFPTAYRRIYCRKVLMLSNQMSRYQSKCNGMTHHTQVSQEVSPFPADDHQFIKNGRNRQDSIIKTEVKHR